MSYDAAGNLTNDGYQSYFYDATGQQTYASITTLAQSYDGDRLRVKKVESGVTTYYLRSSVLGGQVISELGSNGSLQRGYVYLGNQMLSIQQNNQVSWVHQDPVTKSQRITDSNGAVTSAIDLDPWGGETSRSSNTAFQPHRYTTYERDANGGDEAMMRRYAGKWHRFVQPDPSDGSYDWTNPQSFNRYAYVQNEPVNFVDPLGLDPDAEGGVGNLAALWAFERSWSVVIGAAFSDGGGEVGMVIEPNKPVIAHEIVPQNPRVGPEDLKVFKARLEEMLKNKDCANYLQQLLTEVGTQTGRSSGAILTTFDAIRFYWRNTGAAHGGYAYWEEMGTVRAADIMNTLNTEKMGGSRANQMDRRGFLISETTQAFLAETMHHLSQGGRMYSDPQMANALNAVLVRQGLDTHKNFPDKTATDVHNASLYWHPKVASACPAPRK